MTDETGSYTIGEFIEWVPDPHATYEERPMSNLWFNLRIWCWFVQISKDRPLVGVKGGKEIMGSRFRFSKQEGRPKSGEPWIELYELRWPW